MQGGRCVRTCVRAITQDEGAQRHGSDEYCIAKRAGMREGSRLQQGSIERVGGIAKQFVSKQNRAMVHFDSSPRTCTGGRERKSQVPQRIACILLHDSPVNHRLSLPSHYAVAPLGLYSI